MALGTEQIKFTVWRDGRSREILGRNFADACANARPYISANEMTLLDKVYQEGVEAPILEKKIY
jgi:hypothetical protein